MVRLAISSLADLPVSSRGLFAERLAQLKQATLPVVAGFVVSEPAALLLKRGKQYSLCEDVWKRMTKQTETWVSRQMLVLLADQTVRQVRVAGSQAELRQILTEVAEQVLAAHNHLELIVLTLPSQVSWSGTVRQSGDSIEVTAYRGYPALVGPAPAQAVVTLDPITLVVREQALKKQRYALGIRHGQTTLVHFRPDAETVPHGILIRAAALQRALEAAGRTEPVSWIADARGELSLVGLPGAETHLSPEPSVVPLSPGFAVGPVRLIRSTADLVRILPGEIVILDHFKRGLLEYLDAVSGVVVQSLAGGQAVRNAIEQKGIPLIYTKALPRLKTGQLITLDAISGQLAPGKLRRPDAVPRTVQPNPPGLPAIVAEVGSADAAIIASQAGADGVIFMPETLLLSQGAALGRHVGHSLGRDRLAAALKPKIEPTAALWPHTSFRYRLSDLLSDERAELLPNSSAEANPLLGQHGLSYHLAESGLAQTELVVLRQLLDEKMSTIELVLPFARSAGEVQAFCAWLDQHRFLPHTLPRHLTVATPALLSTLSQLASLPLASIVFDLATFARLSFGQSELGGTAPLEMVLAEALVRLAAATERLDLPWTLQAPIELLTPELLTEAKRHHVHSLLVAATEIEETRQLLTSLHHHTSAA